MWGGNTLQSSIILSSTLYSNIKLTLDRKYFHIIIKKIKIFFFFSMCTSKFGWPSSPLCPQLSAFGWPSYPLSVAIRCGWSQFGQLTEYNMINIFLQISCWKWGILFLYLTLHETEASRQHPSFNTFWWSSTWKQK